MSAVTELKISLSSHLSLFVCLQAEVFLLLLSDGLAWWSQTLLACFYHECFSFAFNYDSLCGKFWFFRIQAFLDFIVWNESHQLLGCECFLCKTWPSKTFSILFCFVYLVY